MTVARLLLLLPPEETIRSSMRSASVFSLTVIFCFVGMTTTSILILILTMTRATRGVNEVFYNQRMKKTGFDEPNRVVYSTDRSLVCPVCRGPIGRCACAAEVPPKGDGVVRVRREVNGRGGKTVTVVTGVLLGKSALADLAGELKKRCGTGGTSKDGVIEIQGDHRDTVVEALRAKGHTVKLAGG